MTEADKLMIMRGNNRHFMRLVTPHELIPGHHLQMFYAARHQTHRDLFSTPFYIEGWAFSRELRLWDLDWAKTPGDRIGMLFWRMTRAARIIVSLNYHLGRMKPEEMVDLLVQRVGHEKFGATSEVRRFIHASPLNEASYMIGGMQLETLRRELTGPGNALWGASGEGMQRWRSWGPRKDLACALCIDAGGLGGRGGSWGPGRAARPWRRFWGL
jgi:hypothetical protein